MNSLRLAALVLVMWSLVYSTFLLSLSRRVRRHDVPAPPDLLYVFVVPCLNEDKVIGRTVESLLRLNRNDVRVLVIDDASSDETPTVLSRFAGHPDVAVLRRELPAAQLGKGHALNDAYRALRAEDWGECAPIVCVLDADGRLVEGALDEVGPMFSDPVVGAVQIGVRIRNAADSLLARMQDIEFLVYTDVFQTGRNLLGSTGLGGNGQFVRLAALETLGEDPWSDCLTEDLELGLNLLLHGHENRYCPTAAVDQQGVVSFRKFIKQRTRWFQGHLQCWNYVPRLLRSGLRIKTKLDLVYHLVSPVVLLAASLLIMVGWAATLVGLVFFPEQVLHTLLDERMLVTYVFGFGLSPLVAWVYWRHEPQTSLLAGLGYAHLYVLYSSLWFIAGWRAVGRTALRRRSWAKTARIDEVEEAQHAVLLGAGK